MLSAHMHRKLSARLKGKKDSGVGGVKWWRVYPRRRMVTGADFNGHIGEGNRGDGDDEVKVSRRRMWKWRWW